MILSLGDYATVSGLLVLFAVPVLAFLRKIRSNDLHHLDMKLDSVAGSFFGRPRNHSKREISAWS